MTCSPRQPLARPDVRPPGRKSRGSRTGLVCWLALGAGLCLASCSLDRRYRVLSFFFDGVPDPNAPHEPEGPQISAVDFTKLSSAERAEYLASKIEAPTVYFHKPVQERLCDSCHVFEKADASKPGWMAGTPTLVVPLEELCARCHDFPDAPFVHGPVATRRCYFCHEPHQSTYPHLLRSESVNSVCRSCHVGETFVTEQQHAGNEPGECTVCHDPHASDRRYFLLDEVRALGAAASGPPEESE